MIQPTHVLPETIVFRGQCIQTMNALSAKKSLCPGASPRADLQDGGLLVHIRLDAAQVGGVGRPHLPEDPIHAALMAKRICCPVSALPQSPKRVQFLRKAIDHHLCAFRISVRVAMFAGPGSVDASRVRPAATQPWPSSGRK